jgi:signal transduction histidine kinase
VAVTDHGCGLGEGAEARLFEPFFTTKENGIGMGLAISRSIVSAHRGRMWFTRNPDRGTTFHFTVPGGGKGHDDSD